MQRILTVASLMAIFLPTLAYFMLTAVLICVTLFYISVLLHLCGSSFLLDRMCDVIEFTQRIFPKAKARCVAIQAILQTQFRK